MINATAKLLTPKLLEWFLGDGKEELVRVIAKMVVENIDEEDIIEKVAASLSQRIQIKT